MVPSASAAAPLTGGSIVVRRLGRIRLRQAPLVTGRRPARRNQAHRVRTLPFPRRTLLIPVVATVGLLIALRPGDVTRATPPSTWTPLPQSAFGPVSAVGRQAQRAETENRGAPVVALGVPDAAPSAAAAAPAAPAARPGGPTVTPGGAINRVVRDDKIAPSSISAEPSVTTRGRAPATTVVASTAKPSPRAGAQAKPTAAVAAPRGPIHVVTGGDNLWTIARRHSADLTSILRGNGGINAARLVAGQRIVVPGGSKMTPLPKPAAAKPRTTSSQPAKVSRPASVARQTSLRGRSGSHLWPLALRGIITTRFSAAHPGIDIAAPQGTPVRAIAAGTVVWAGWKRNGGGYVVEIAHPNGMRSTYNHNSKLKVRRGDKVAKGETVALVGSTGYSTGPHLDIRISMGGRLVDPLRVY